MIIQGVPLTRLMKWADRACAVFLLLTFFSPIVLFYTLRNKYIQEDVCFAVHRTEKAAKSFNYETIGKGALAIEEGFRGVPLPNLQKETLLISSNEADDCFLFGLKSSFEKRESKSGEKHYLAYGKRGELLFSKKPSPFFLIPTLHKGKLQVEVGLVIELDDQMVVDEKAKFVATQANQEQTARFLGEGVFGEPFIVMEGAKLLAPDQLFVLYGGEEYESEAHSARLLFNEGLIYVQRGDTLFFEKGEWKLGKEQTKKTFLAKILSTSAQRVDAEISDSKGLLKRKISICRKPSRNVAFRAGEVFSQIRPRTATTVSLKIAGKSDHLKRGDWLLKDHNGWQLLGKWEDVESYLRFDKRGELFVFDGVEKGHFCGHYFDAMREKCEMVRLPLSETTKKKVPLPRKPLFTPSQEQDDEDLDFD